MAQKRIALAFTDTGKDAAPTVVYCGTDADACETAIRGALAGGTFARTERYLLASPVVKYADAPAPAPAPAGEEAPAEEKPKSGRKSAK